MSFAPSIYVPTTIAVIPKFTAVTIIWVIKLVMRMEKSETKQILQILDGLFNKHYTHPYSTGLHLFLFLLSRLWVNPSFCSTIQCHRQYYHIIAILCCNYNKDVLQNVL